MDDAKSECPGCVELRAMVAQLVEQNRKLSERVDAQQLEIEELKARLGRDSSNSSRPPSSDPPWKKRERARTPSGKKPGGQPGHQGTTRQLFAAAAVDATHEHRPSACPCCGSTDLAATDEEPYRHQVTEIPKTKPHVEEHRLFAMRCKQCGGRAVAALPQGVPSDHFGPRLKATVAYFTGVARQSKRETQRVFDELLGVDLGGGTISLIERRVTKALDWSYREAQRALREGALAHVDETPWREARRPAWLWAATDRRLAVFHVDRKRSRKAYRRLFAGIFRGFLVADRLAVYDKHPLARRQACAAHVLRDFEGFVTGPRRRRAFGREGRRVFHRLFGLWHRFQEGRLDRARLAVRMQRVRERLVALLERAKSHTHARVRRFAAHLGARVESLFGFLANPDLVEPTNNPAERVLRKGVLWRKGSYGTASETGSRFVERILTVSESLRAQGRSVLDFLVESMIAQANGLPPPSLLPAAN